MPHLFSSAIHHIDYDEYHRRLFVTFRGARRAGSQAAGRSYTYFDVPKDEYLAMMQARSPGAYFNDRIKDRYTVRQSVSY